MRRVLIDSGPLIALFDRSDRHHERVLNFLRSFEGELVSSWPVLTEVSHMLDFNVQVQLDFLEWIHRGAITLPEITRDELGDMIDMMRTYTNVPMDLADATLIYLAHREKIEEIISIDSDFSIYRTLKKRFVRNILPQ
ncbi:PIN domain-containing protein [Nitratifractor sp.]|uniref:type II toxin-antitoxin system VapC family toxin n=1 Tax=Nitratifractor sp. TaxID=2268144 RepID=UPI0025D075EC|nr:PIN domain-containing protein [Nitratifractor sp.]